MTTPDTIPRTRLPVRDYSHLVPLPDPKREPDMQQEDSRFRFVSMLQAHFRSRDDVLIAGGGYVREQATDDSERFSPDLVVTFGVRPNAIIARNGYVISEVGKPPDWALEVASRATGQRDYTIKREAYAKYGIREYWRFDRTGGRFHDAPLAGDRLLENRYVPIELNREPDGLIWGHSPVLGLDICWDDGQLRLRDPQSGEFLTDAAQTKTTLDLTQDALQESEDALQTTRAKSRRTESQLDTANEEILRLRQELRQLRGD